MFHFMLVVLSVCSALACMIYVIVRTVCVIWPTGSSGCTLGRHAVLSSLATVFQRWCA
jgi:hypothetical protein